MAIEKTREKTLDTLSRLKGIETVRIVVGVVRIVALDTLSRLKGIETNTHPEKFIVELSSFDFGYAFPFEGN